MSTASVFAGYAYYSNTADGFVYALTNATAPASLDPSIVVGSAVARASHFFPVLFLIAGGVLNLLLLVAVAITVYCRLRVTQLEKRYWRLQHAYAEVNNTFVGELLDRTPVGPAWPTKGRKPTSKPKRHRSSSSKSSTAKRPRRSPSQEQKQPRPTPSPQPSPQTQPQPQPQQTQQTQRASPQSPQQPQSQQRTKRVSITPPSHAPQQRLSNAWLTASEPVGVYPPRKASSQPLFANSLTEEATGVKGNSDTYDYNTMYVPVPIISLPHTARASPQENTSASSPEHVDVDLTLSEDEDAVASTTSAPQHTLRRRTSKVSFINTA